MKWLLLDSGLVEYSYHLVVIPAEAGIHIKLIYEKIDNLRDYQV